MLMKEKNRKPYVWAILLTEAVGALSGWLSKGGMRLYSDTVSQPPCSADRFRQSDAAKRNCSAQTYFSFTQAEKASKS